MSLSEALVLGIVQGLTEFLPISSTAHVRIIPALLDLLSLEGQWGDPGAAASAIIQLGTMGAVLVYFRRDIGRLTWAFLCGLKRGRPFDTREARMAWFIGLGSLPIVVCGLLFECFITSQARSLWIIGLALIGLALLLYLAERLSSRRRTLDQVDLRDALVVGLAQALALIPGSSRSGTTITAGLFLGLTRETAARFSFLLSIPAVAGSGFYELYEVRHWLTTDLGLSLIVATGVSLVSGYAAIAFLLKYLQSHSTIVFVIYRLVVGGLLLAMLWAGAIK